MMKIAIFALFACVLLSTAEAQSRRVRLRPRPVQVIDDQLQYYEADDRAGDEDVVLVSPADELSLYGRQAARSDNYIRPAAAKPSRTKESSKAPPVQTIRNYNKVNDDGSFTFGYEAADGSFKEETRGTDCVVRGKYGYVDPDGNKREFTYVSGNPCDPNAAADDDDQDDVKEESNEASNEPANYPSRPARPLHTTPRPTTVFQNVYRQHPEIEEQEVQVPATRIPRPPPTPIAITPRPQLPATTYKPQLLRITQRPVTQRPQVVYSSVIPTSSTPSSSFATSARPSTVGQIDFAAEFAKFQRENQIVSSTPATFKTQSKASEPPTATGNPIFSTQLVYDPSSGQYNSQLYQTLPQTNGEFTLNHRVQPTVSLPQAPRQPQGFSPPLYRHRLQHPVPQEIRAQPQIRNPQELYQRHQNEQLYQNSQQLFAQQQQLQHSQLQQDRQAARQAALAQAVQLQQQQQPQQQQQFYYVAPGRDSQSGGQIDAFLRGHGVPF